MKKENSRNTYTTITTHSDNATTASRGKEREIINQQSMEEVVV